MYQMTPKEFPQRIRPQVLEEQEGMCSESSSDQTGIRRPGFWAWLMGLGRHSPFLGLSFSFRERRA